MRAVELFLRAVGFLYVRGRGCLPFLLLVVRACLHAVTLFTYVRVCVALPYLLRACVRVCLLPSFDVRVCLLPFFFFFFYECM